MLKISNNNKTQRKNTIKVCSEISFTKIYCHIEMDGEFGFLGVKCSEEYGNIDPKDIYFISKNHLFYSVKHILKHL